MTATTVALATVGIVTFVSSGHATSAIERGYDLSVSDGGFAQIDDLTDTSRMTAAVDGRVFVSGTSESGESVVVALGSDGSEIGRYVLGPD